MKKCIFASLLLVVAMAFSSCKEEVTMDSFIFVTVNSAFSWSSGQQYTTGFDQNSLDSICAVIVKEKGYELLSAHNFLIRAQKERAEVVEKGKDFATEMDKRIKAQYGDPVKVDSRYTKLQVVVSTAFGDTEKETVAIYPYK